MQKMYQTIEQTYCPFPAGTSPESSPHSVDGYHLNFPMPMSVWVIPPALSWLTLTNLLDSGCIPEGLGNGCGANMLRHAVHYKQLQ
jgi:hypothetical protein